MASEPATEAVSQEGGTQDDGAPLFQKWKLTLIVLTAIGGFFNGRPALNSMSYALGSSVGLTVSATMVMALTTILYRRFYPEKLAIVRPRAYVAICIVAGIVAAIGGLILNPAGIFLFVYLLLLLFVAVVEAAIQGARAVAK